MRAMVTGLALGLALLACPAIAEEAVTPLETPNSFFGGLQQVPLTEDQVQHYIDSMAEMQAAMGDAPADAVEPDAATMTKLGAIAKKHGFQDFNEYNTVAGNIALVLDGVDPVSKTYVGAETLLKKLIADVEADKEMSEADKKASLADLQMQMKAVLPVKNKSNIDLVVKNYDALNRNE